MIAVLLKWYISVSKQRPGSFQWPQPECSLCLTAQPSNSPSFHFAGFWPNNSAGHRNSTLVTHPFVHSLFSLCQTCQISLCQAERKEGREGLHVISREQNEPHAGFPFIWPTLSHFSLIPSPLHYWLWDHLVVCDRICCCHQQCHFQDDWGF